MAAVTLLVATACAGPAASVAPSTAPTAGATTAPTAAATQMGGNVSIIASWTGAEQDSFMAMIQPWVDANGVHVDYVGTRDMQAQLSNAIAAGGTGLPDVAGIPGPGLARDWYATQLGDGTTALKPLDFLNLDEYKGSTPPGMAELGVASDGKLVGIFTKSAVKGLIWYAKAHYDGTVPASFSDLEGMDAGAMGSLWCNAIESGAASGWPFTDWIEDIVIRQSGPDVYDSWVAGTTKWTSPEIKGAFDMMVDVINKSDGGGTKINATAFGDVGGGLFSDPPTCEFVHQASFISSFFTDQSGAQPGAFDFFVMPDINSAYAGALTGGGDMFGMFHDTPQARSLMAYLTTVDAQSIWAARGGYISANTGVPSSVYKDDSDRKAATALQNASSFRFDGSDSMPGEMNQAFFDAMVALAANPADEDNILMSLDATQATAYGN
ncbi:MAG: extracellular solute-binding protein [Chloroflexota bacterium]